ncbi:MAG TPA: hypothetical protein VKT70_00180 [Stellaceae bacterium]|nr:hypothetical protein [Stellaceae bacterium]
MKLFQIEEPEGGVSGAGVAVGMVLARSGAEVAMSVGGNGEVLAGDGLATTELWRSGGPKVEVAVTLLLALRERAEKRLARPVTHAVILVDGLDPASGLVYEAAAAEAGIAVLALRERGIGGTAVEAAIEAEALALL